ncbi:unnamed protein product [Closterium sp. Yama58-4]|nr:unnamed protein product [Closterium sp. Yama58-4]
MAAVGTAQAMDIEPQFRAAQYHAPCQDPPNVVNLADASMDQIGSPDRMPRRSPQSPSQDHDAGSSSTSCEPRFPSNAGSYESRSGYQVAPSRTASPPRRDSNSLFSRRNRGELSPLTTFQSLSTSAQASSASATPLESFARGGFAPADGGRSSRSPSPRLFKPATGTASSTSSPDHPATGLYLGPATRNSPRALAGGGIPSAQRAGSPAGVSSGVVAGAGLPVNPFNLAHGGCPRSPMRSRQQLSAHGGSQRAIAPSPLSELLSAGGSNRMDIQPDSLEADTLQIQIPKDQKHLSQQQFPSNGRSQHNREEHPQERDSCVEQQTQQQPQQQARQLYSQQSVPSAVPSAMLSVVPSSVPSHRSPRSSSLDSYDHVIVSHSPHGDFGGTSHVPFAQRPQLPSPKQLHAPLNPHASQTSPPQNGAPGHISPSRGSAPIATPRPARPSHRRTASASAASALLQHNFSADMLEGSSSPRPAFFSRPPPSPRHTPAQPIAPSAAAALVAAASAGSGPATPRGASPRRSSSPAGVRVVNSASRAVQDLHARLLAAAQMIADGDTAGAAATAEAAAAVAAAMQQQQWQAQQQGGGKRQGRAIGISELQMELGAAQGRSAAGGDSPLRGNSPLPQAGGPAAQGAGLAGAASHADRSGRGAVGAVMRSGGASPGAASERAEQLKRRGSAMLREEDMRALSHMSLGDPSGGAVGSGGLSGEISGRRQGAGDCAGFAGSSNGGAGNGDAGVCNRPVKQRVSTGHRSASSSGVGAGIGVNNGGGSGGGSSGGGSGDYASALSAAAAAALSAAGAPVGISPGEITQIAQKWMELQAGGALGGAQGHMGQSGQTQQQARPQHQVVPQVFSQVVAPHRQQQGRQLNATLGAGVRKPASFSGNVEDVFGQYEGLPPRDHVLRKEYGEIKGLFVLHSKELGSGQFGIIRPCMEVATGQVFACKTINKKCIQSKEDAEDIRKEVACLTLLRGHPTIVALRDTVEDEENIHIVMELCQGGDLFDRVSSSGRLTEQCAARLCRALVEALLHCHCHGILHRDIKPENILLCDRSENSRIKLVDFGVATFFEPGKRLTEVLGTPEYMAPEVLLQSYGPEADIWSAGVVLYILLCGVPPFWASSRKCVAEAILKGSVSFKSAKWANASEECKELVRRMLTKDPRERITALEILDHPWIRRYQ